MAWFSARIEVQADLVGAARCSYNSPLALRLKNRRKARLYRYCRKGHGFHVRLRFSETIRAMIGHGRPAFLAVALARAPLVLCACFFINSATAQNAPPAEPTQLRITWGGGDPTRWIGRVAVDEG